MKIRNKILLYSLGITFISLLIVMADSFYNVDKNIVENAESKLEAIANIQKNRVESELRNYEIQAGLVASRTALTKETASFNTNNDPKTAETIKSIILDAKKSVGDFKAIYILDRTAKTISGTDAKIIEKSIENSKIISSEEKIQTFILDDSTSFKDLLIIAPIKKDNAFQGYAVVIIISNNLQEIMADYSGLGETGETTIAYKNNSGDAQYIRPPRFADMDSNLSVSKEKIDVAITQALAGVEVLSKNNIDYRGQQIYAVTKHLDSTDWGMVAKIDKAELYQPIISHAIQLGAIGLVLILLVIIFSLRIANGIARPIEELKEGAEEIAKGDFDHDVVIDSKDEIGNLSKSFDQMMKAVIASRAEVDFKVNEQTKEISAKAADMQDQQKAIINILEDVEEEKEITKREKDKVDTILKSIGDAVFVVDKDLKIILVNQVTIDLCGYSEVELVGQKYSDVLHFVFESDGDKPEVVNDRFVNDAISTGEVQEMSNHTVLVAKDKNRIPVSDSAAPLKNQKNEIIGCVVVFRDVTREYEVDKAKTEFVSLASHQLRTPLSAINWYAEMLTNGDAGELTDEQKKFVDEIYKGNQRMVDLVNSLLNVSRLELGTFMVEPISTDIVEMSKDVVREMTPMIKEKKLVVDEDYDKNVPMMNVDPKLTRIILQNLVSNAVKYTEKGSVDVSIGLEKDNLLIKVSDTGLGIPKSQQDKIFQKLFRADNVRQTDTEGTGLGLYIIKSILDNAGGTIRFESKENHGTTFFATIPLSGMIKKDGSKTID